MDIGMLWFDDSTRPFEEKLQRAVGYYVEKYGRTPTLCLVNPDTLEARRVHMGGIELRQARTVMPDHLWIGVDEESQRAVAAGPAAEKAPRRVPRKAKSRPAQAVLPMPEGKAA
jgi:hypothetical protein